MPREWPSASRERALSTCCCACLARGLVLWDAISSSLGATGELGLWSSSSGLALEWDGVEGVGHKKREIWKGKEAKGKRVLFPFRKLASKENSVGVTG